MTSARHTLHAAGATILALLLSCSAEKEEPYEQIDLGEWQSSPGSEDSDADTDADADADGDTDADTDTDTDADADDDRDNDGDGFRPEDGDCNDSDDEVHPGVTVDDCNGVDNDCDGHIDENFSGDDYEPNDVDAAYVGDLNDGTIVVDAYISPAYDVDIYQFYVEDSWFDWFDIELSLTNVPADADYKLELYWVEDKDGVSHGLVEEEDDGGLGEDEHLDYGGEWFGDGDGYYEAIVSGKEGQGCDFPYELEIVTDGVR